MKPNLILLFNSRMNSSFPRKKTVIYRNTVILIPLSVSYVFPGRIL